MARLGLETRMRTYDVILISARRYGVLTSKARLARIGSRFPLSEAILQIWQFGLRYGGLDYDYGG